ncbi:enoyl-CoA hydratase/isomerase family protein, partial [Diaphorobacter sp. DS2]
GYALGGGCELALACDIRIAAKGAKFGLPELNLGIIPGAGGTQRLSRVVGKGRALDMILTGKIINGEEAERIGLATYLAADDELETKAEEVASQILKKGPVAIKLAKLAVHKGFDVDLETAMLIEKLSQAVAFGTEDKREGTAAFLEKRTAEFTNQ